jgi:hypothetical protein
MTALLHADLEACLADYAKRFEPESAAALLLEYVGSSTTTVSRWLRGHEQPRGELNLRLRCYLELVGYKVTESEKVLPIAREVCDLIGYGLVTFEEVQQSLDYATPQSVYRILLHGGNIQTSNMFRFEMFCTNHRALLEPAQREWRQRIEAELTAAEAAEAEADQPAALPDIVLIDTMHLVNATTITTKALVAHLEALASCGEEGVMAYYRKAVQPEITALLHLFGLDKTS